MNTGKPETEGNRASHAWDVSGSGQGVGAAASSVAVQCDPYDTPPGTFDDRLAAILVGRGLATVAQVNDARAATRTLALPLGRILQARDLISEAELLSALSQLYGTAIVDLHSDAPDPALAGSVPAERAIGAEAIPWRRAGSALVVATARPDLLTQLEQDLPPGMRLLPVLASREKIASAQHDAYGAKLAREAEGRAPEEHSCRVWNPRSLAGRAYLVAMLLAALAVLQPGVAIVGAMGLAILVYAANLTLKLLSLGATLIGKRPPRPEGAAPTLLRLPVVTVLVPLYREAEIASHLVRRLARLDYPPERLDVILCVEEDDAITSAALAATHLPPHIRAIRVPPGTPRTKPRALNYALNYARGTIIGIYDAEDRPDPDQITRIVHRFAEVAPNVACLQGQLDYHNSTHNWIARMFTVEYASWFRVLLPGVQRLGLVVPLGGTTLFLRREVLEAVGGWDAHNVTEDAELGLRLARAGHRTEIVETTTFEEANAAIRPWIRQRSRWLKGYLVTWATAMRRPVSLWRDLGTWRFLGLQVQILSAVLGFFLAPLLWSFGIKLFGLSHPLDPYMPPAWYPPLFATMLFGTGVTFLVALVGCRAPHLRRQRVFAPLMEFYYILGIAAAWRAVFETLFRPFFWAKTEHGQFGGNAEIEAGDTSQPRPPQSFSASSLSRTTKAMDR
ncbi:glycosyltransferase [Roseibacterium beibuensis]|uniref:Glycosyltransferase n=1 Tax=[Roseibacterium] beibuensis TaxID=1193142 RepID=A0ABP9KZ20_9RHOB|nr:glycosyltransferase [Roseibacterium beibuensis]MCS6622108.1 glycosyltransferase [Roseibacterium beibuensis]